MENKKGRSTIVWCVILFVLVVVIVVMMAMFLADSKNKSEAKAQHSVSESANQQPIMHTEYVETEKLVEVEVEKNITAEIMQDGLRQMGVLITQEYYFTQVENYTTTKTYLKFINSESGFMYSYDGVVTAGIDFNEVKVAKDENRGRIVISMPKATIQQIDIDFESFEVYSEKEGLWNKIKIEDYNESLVEFEKNARDKAIDKGILDRADEDAQRIIENFLSGLIDMNEYELEFIQQ